MTTPETGGYEVGYDDAGDVKIIEGAAREDTPDLGASGDGMGCHAGAGATNAHDRAPRGAGLGPASRGARRRYDTQVFWA